MTIIDWKEAQPHATLTATMGGKREWSAPYILTSDNPRDDAKTCVDFMDTIGRGLRTTFRYGDREDSGTWCKTISPVRMSNSATHWSVTSTYSPPIYAEQQNADGEPTEDPLDWKYDISCGTQLYQVPVWKAWNVDPFPVGGSGKGYVRGVNTLGPVHNSAGIVYDPPLMRDVPETVFRVTGNCMHCWVAELSYVGCINEYPCNFHDELTEKYGVTAQWFNPNCILLSAATPTYRIENEFRFWEHTYEFRFRYPASDINPQDGFLETLLDRGLTRIANPGAPDGAGGEYTSGQFKAGMAEAAAIRDVEGERVPEMVLLDGHGQPLRGSDTYQAPPVYFRWRIHPHSVFTYPTIPLKIFQS